MYKILVVDDEKIERNGIKFLIGRMDIKVEVAEAQNGKVAIEYLQNHQVDILLTDIKMPFMDGIELIQNVAGLYPDMKIIIFSGYNDFEFAKQAIRYGVVDYILKPVNPAEFESTMKKSIDELEKLKMEKKREGESLSFMKEHLLYSLVNGQTKSELQKRTEGLFDIEFIDDYRRMFLIEFEQDFFDKMGSGFDEALVSCLNNEFQYLNLNPAQGLLFFGELEGVDWKQMGNRIFWFVQDTYKCECHIAISEEFTDGDLIPKRFTELEELMEKKFFQTENHVYLSFRDENTKESVQGDADTLTKQMQQDIKMKDITGLREHFQQFCTKYQNQTMFSQVYIKFIFSNLLKDFYSNIPGMDEKKLDHEIDVLYRANDLKGVMNIVQRNIERLEAVFAKNPQTYRREVEVIQQYIYDHYNEEIGVDQLARQVYMTPSYLSAIFKKETGQNLSKFIKAYRMEKAKKMLEKTNEKIVNISCAVGYTNVSYFCQSFREYFGVSPQKFRDKGDLYEMSE